MFSSYLSFKKELFEKTTSHGRTRVGRLVAAAMRPRSRVAVAWVESSKAKSFWWGVVCGLIGLVISKLISGGFLGFGKWDGSSPQRRVEFVRKSVKAEMDFQQRLPLGTLPQETTAQTTASQEKNAAQFKRVTRKAKPWNPSALPTRTNQVQPHISAFFSAALFSCAFWRAAAFSLASRPVLWFLSTQKACRVPGLYRAFLLTVVQAKRLCSIYKSDDMIKQCTKTKPAATSTAFKIPSGNVDKAWPNYVHFHHMNSQLGKRWFSSKWLSDGTSSSSHPEVMRLKSKNRSGNPS